LIGHNLGIRGEMTLALGADTGGDADTTIRLYLNPRALIRPNAGSLDVADKPQPQVATRTARLRLCCGEELPVADEFHRQVQGRFVITAVIGERREVLEDDLVVIGELVGLDEVPPSYLGSVQPQLPGGDVQ